MIVGAGTVLFWLYAPIEIDGKSLSSIIYEIVPGFLLGGATAILVSILGRNVKPHVVHRFNEMEKVMNQDAG
jgi:SSS family solute:Na+ symporter/sodium/proline symporter